MEKLYNHYKDKAQFFVVYIKEAHPEDGWAIPVNGKYFMMNFMVLPSYNISDCGFATGVICKSLIPHYNFDRLVTI